MSDLFTGCVLPVLSPSLLNAPLTLSPFTRFPSLTAPPLPPSSVNFWLVVDLGVEQLDTGGNVIERLTKHVRKMGKKMHN